MRDAERGTSMRFAWEQASERYQVDVWGPLGQGRTRLTGDPEWMRIARGDEVLAEGPPSAIMATQLGWQVPVAYLPVWIRGAPLPNEAVADAQLDGEGRYVGFTQAGWQVALSGYQAAANPVSPARIVAVNGARKVTVVVREFVEFHP